MPRPRTGTVIPHGDHFDIRITLPNGVKSKRKCLRPGISREEAQAMASERSDFAAKLGADAGPAAIDESFETWAGRWTAYRKERGIGTAEGALGQLAKWAFPEIGHASVRAVGARDLERLVARLDRGVAAAELSWKTAKNVWGIVTKGFV